MKIKKQDQIRQMIEIITKSQFDCGKQGCENCKYRKEDECVLRQDANYIATILVKNGFAKIPSGAVVLTPEERDDEMKATNEILAERDELKADIVALLVALDDITDDLCRKDKQIASAYGLYKLKKAAGMLKELKLDDEQEESGDEQKD